MDKVLGASETGTKRIEPVGLLKAKLQRPRITRDLVVRPRLLERLNDDLSRQLTLVCAPAGFGKTTLVNSWLDSIAAAREADPALPTAAWLSLDEHDSDVVIFLRYLIAALRTIFPNAGAKALALLRAPHGLSPAKLFATLNNEIETLPGKVVLVLDDYHLLTGCSVHEFVESLLCHWPRPLHLVLLTRIDPPLPLASLRARDKITEIRATDLRFNTEETNAYLDRALEMPLGPGDRARLEERTGGWIAALRLATLSLRNTITAEGVPPIGAQAGRNMSDYLQDEVLEQQVPAIQTFLLKTSILDRFCVSLAEAVVEQIDPAWRVRACLDWLERADLLIVYMDGLRTWYRYHALVRDFLKERLLVSSGAELVADLYRKAATWFAREGLLHEAVAYALEAGDADLAASLVGTRLRDELNQEDRAMLEHWVNALPEEVVQRRPWLLMLKAWALNFSWQLGRQVKLLSQVEALIEKDGGAMLPEEEVRLLRAQVLVLRAQEAYIGNQAIRCVAHAEEALALLPPSWSFARGGALAYWAMGRGAMGEVQATERVLLEEYETLDDKTSSYALRLLQSLCFNALNAAQLEPLVRTANLVLQQAVRGQKSVSQNWGHFFLGVAAYQRNDLDTAVSHWAEVMDQRYLCQFLCAHQSMAGLAWVYRARGESSEAWRVVELLRRFQVEQQGHEGDEVHSLGARLMLDAGDRDGALRWADGFTALVPDRMLFWVEVPHLTRAHILLARNRSDDVHLALHILDDLLDIAERTYNTRSKISILALRALAEDALDRGKPGDRGDAERALVTLQEAANLAQPGGFLRPFVDLGARMEGLLIRLARFAARPTGDEPVRRILAAFPNSGGIPAQPERADRAVPGIVEPLTARELEILALLREPISPKEIARQLDISYLTVKRHTVNVYGKLGVTARWDAVDRAIALGVLPAR